TDHLQSKAITFQHIKIFIGYCGWDFGELEAEIADGHWETTHLSVEQLFSDWP
ncbi:MAG: YqgE/AlgH family protein, partial [Chitinophagaceae bacterium]